MDAARIGFNRAGLPKKKAEHKPTWRSGVSRGRKEVWGAHLTIGKNPIAGTGEAHKSNRYLLDGEKKCGK